MLRLSRCLGILPDYGHCSVMIKWWCNPPWSLFLLSLLSLLFFFLSLWPEAPFPNNPFFFLITRDHNRHFGATSASLRIEEEPPHNHCVHRLFTVCEPSTFDINIDLYQATPHWSLSRLTGNSRETFNKAATASASAISISITIAMGESTKAGDAVDKLVRALNGKFNGLKFDAWKRTAQSVINWSHTEICDILEGRPCPEPKVISPRPSSIRSTPSRAVTRTQATDETDTQSGETPPAETAENVQPDAGSTPVDTAHLLPSSSGSFTLPKHLLYGPRMTTSRIWKTSSTGTATIVFCSPSCSWAHRDLRPAFLYSSSRNEVNLRKGKAAWDGMVRKIQISSHQRRRILKQQLTHMVMTDVQDPDMVINEVYYLRDELVDMGEVFNDDSILDIVLGWLADKYLQRSSCCSRSRSSGWSMCHWDVRVHLRLLNLDLWRCWREHCGCYYAGHFVDQDEGDGLCCRHVFETDGRFFVAVGIMHATPRMFSRCWGRFSPRHLSLPFKAILESMAWFFAVWTGHYCWGCWRDYHSRFTPLLFSQRPVSHSSIHVHIRHCYHSSVEFEVIIFFGAIFYQQLLLCPSRLLAVHPHLQLV